MTVILNNKVINMCLLYTVSFIKNWCKQTYADTRISQSIKSNCMSHNCNKKKLNIIFQKVINLMAKLRGFEEFLTISTHLYASIEKI